MLIGSRSLLLLPLAALLGCGLSPSNPSSTNTTTSSSNTNTPAAYNFNGTWDAVSTDSALSYPISSIDATLQVSNGTVTGSLYVSGDGSPLDNPNICAAVNTSLPVTGTLDDAHNLMLTFPIAGGTGTILATLANDPTTYAYGTWQIAGGSCAMSETAMAINGTPTTPTVPTVPVPITSTLSGNWAAYATYSPGSIQPVYGFFGVLQFTNGSVTGALNLLFVTISDATNCGVSYGGTAAVTGTLDTNNKLTLTFPITSNGTGTITATLGANPQTLAVGSYQIVGAGACDMPATPMTIAQYAPVTGTYTGTFNVPGTGDVPTPGSDTTVTAVLTQSTSITTSYQYLTGTIAVAGACTDSETYTGLAFASGFGSESFSGSINPTATVIDDAWYGSPKCPVFNVGTLTRQ